MIDPKLRTPLLKTRELPITGYLDRLSARPGESLTAYVSAQAPTPYRTTLVRVITGDPNPSGPGMRFEDLTWRFSGLFAGQRQPIQPGSYVRIPHGPSLALPFPVTWSAMIWTTGEPTKGTILTHADEASQAVLSLGPGLVRGELRTDGVAATTALYVNLEPARWTQVWMSYDPAGARLSVGAIQTSGPTASIVEPAPVGLQPPNGGEVLVGAWGRPAQDHFTGKIERPGIYRGFVERADPTALDLPLIAAWDFAQSIGDETIIGLGPDGRNGTTVNDPTRAVTGSRWSGTETCWRHAPQDYAAIHFHEDDLGDMGWTPSFEFQIPPDLKSGAYAIHLQSEAGQDWLPFYVLPRKQGPRARIAFLAPTYTYLAYANCYFANRTPESRARAQAWDASPYNGRDFGSYGRSTYNWHADGSGVTFSSRRRPILTMRPGFVWEFDAKGSGLRHYAADTHLLGWLDAKGIAYDVITDEDLDDEGVDLIRPYDAVLTGSHPEYHTLGTLDALQAYLGGGGHLAYLGGNGFYWRIARRKDRPDLIELRRAEGGIRLWASEPGEYFNALDGQLGGLWRRSGRTPQSLTGVGFSAQGPYAATYFRRTPASYNGPYAFLFKGVEDDIVGDYGLSAGGAAGFELDRMDRSLGSPKTTQVLATSAAPSQDFDVVPEEMLTESLTLVGEAKASLIRADMTYMTTPAGGGVFSAGSITFCGSLWRDGKPEGPVSTLLSNVLEAFTASR